VATFANRLQALMNNERPRLSLQRLAALVGVTPAAAAKWLAGGPPHPSHINRLCAVFGVRRA